jgi:hypothetical protein
MTQTLQKIVCGAVTRVSDVRGTRDIFWLFAIFFAIAAIPFARIATVPIYHP